DEGDLGVNVGFAATQPAEVVEVFAPIPSFDHRCQRIAYQTGSLAAQQGRTGQVDGTDAAAAVEGEIAHGGLVIKFGVPLQGRFQFGLGVQQPAPFLTELCGGQFGSGQGSSRGRLAGDDAFGAAGSV